MATTNTMRAWMHTSIDLPLEKGMTLVEDAPRPSESLKPNEILIKVKSVGVNPADPTFSELSGPIRAFVKPNPISGMDFSGEVAATGSSVTSLSPGDRVYGRCDTQKGAPGSMAEYTKTVFEACVPIPPGMNFDQAAGIGTAAITAYESLVLNSKSGDSVFINGGTGGVGTFAIQFAKAHGCKVTVSCSAAKAELCKELGADEVVDYRSKDFVSALKAKGKVFDLVVDYAYREEVSLYKASDDFLTEKGTYVMVPGGVSGTVMKTISKNMLCPSMLGGGRAAFKAYFAKNNRAAFLQISDWVAAGKVRTVVDFVFEFEEMPKAIEQIKSGRSTGKIIVHVQ